KWSVIGGWLPSLTFAFGRLMAKRSGPRAVLRSQRVRPGEEPRIRFNVPIALATAASQGRLAVRSRDPLSSPKSSAFHHRHFLYWRRRESSVMIGAAHYGRRTRI